jgi:mannose/fructose/N-acetylgalactosamine-specific phosphotransferase system component IID
MATGLTSAAGFTVLLDENEDIQVKQYALEKLNEVVDQFWPEIADVHTIEKMYEFLARMTNSIALITLVFFCLLVRFFTKMKNFQQENWLLSLPQK